MIRRWIHTDVTDLLQISFPTPSGSTIASTWVTEISKISWSSKVLSLAEKRSASGASNLAHYMLAGSSEVMAVNLGRSWQISCAAMELHILNWFPRRSTVLNSTRIIERSYRMKRTECGSEECECSSWGAGSESLECLCCGQQYVQPGKASGPSAALSRSQVKCIWWME